LENVGKREENWNKSSIRYLEFEKTVCPLSLSFDLHGFSFTFTCVFWATISRDMGRFIQFLEGYVIWLKMWCRDQEDWRRWEVWIVIQNDKFKWKQRLAGDLIFVVRWEVERESRKRGSGGKKQEKEKEKKINDEEVLCLILFVFFSL
jgi:hypothetical protein